MDGTGAAVIAVVTFGGEAARSFECHRDVRLGFTAWNDDSEALFFTDLLTATLCHLLRLKFDISIKSRTPRRRIAFIIIKGSAFSVKTGGVSGCWRAMLERASGSGKDSSRWRRIVRGGP